MGRRGETSPPLPSLSLSQGTRGLMWLLSLSLPRRGEAGGEGASRDSPVRRAAWPGGVGLDNPRWLRGGPSSQSSPVGRRRETPPPPSLSLPQRRGGRAIRESPLRDVTGFDGPLSERQCLLDTTLARRYYHGNEHTFVAPGDDRGCPVDAQVTDLTAPASGSEAPRRGAGRTPRLRCRGAQTTPASRRLATLAVS